MNPCPSRVIYPIYEGIIVKWRVLISHPICTLFKWGGVLF